MKQEEHDTQCEIFRWAETEMVRHPELKYMFSTLNGVRLNIGQAVKAKKAGNKKGVPDIWLPVKRGQYSGLVIELKKAVGGTVSKEQANWLGFLGGQCYRAVVRHGFMDAITEIIDYLKGDE
jgi:hypothetical protein